MEQDGKPKRISSTKELLNAYKKCVLEWQCQSPDLCPTEIMWKNLKNPAHANVQC